MSSELTYLASPYSHDDPAVRKERADKVCQAAAQIITAGGLVYSPIAHSVALEPYLDEGPADYAYWRESDERMIRCCDTLTVLTLEGWGESVGVTAEIEYAEGLGMRVIYWAPV